MMRPVRYKEVSKPPKQKKRLASGTKSQRTGGSKKGNGKWFTKWWGILIIVGLIIAGVVGIIALGIAMGWISNPFAIAPTPTPTSYDMKVWDGAINKELQTKSFDYKLYGTNTSDFADFDLLETGDDLSDISNNDLVNPSTDNHYTTFWVEFNGTQVHDDDIYGSANDRGARVYGERWQIIKPNVVNNLITYETPNLIAMIVWNANNGTVYTALGATDVMVGVNITIALVMNASQTTAMLVPYYNPSVEDTVQVTLTAAFDDIVTTGDFRLAGSSGTRQSGNLEILFTLGSMMPGNIVMSGTWRGATINGDASYLDSLTLQFGDTVLVALT